MSPSERRKASLFAAMSNVQREPWNHCLILEKLQHDVKLILTSPPLTPARSSNWYTAWAILGPVCRPGRAWNANNDDLKTSPACSVGRSYAIQWTVMQMYDRRCLSDHMSAVKWSAPTAFWIAKLSAVQKIQSVMILTVNSPFNCPNHTLHVSRTATRILDRWGMSSSV